MAKSVFKVFLSHRYKSPVINQYFFDLLASYGSLQFEVDVGTKTTNVTRLERLIRDCDAFVGIYPFPADDDKRPDQKTALEASRYFRLELDIAIRSRRPAIVFVDARYGTAIAVPKTVRECRYDHNEIVKPPSNSRTNRFRTFANRFCAEVAASMRLTGAKLPAHTRDRVGVLLPERHQVPTGYSKQQIESLFEQLTQLSLEPVSLSWRTPVSGGMLRQLDDLDWAVVDVGSDSFASGLPAFIHGHFIPQMRIMRARSNTEQSPLERSLLAGFEVGYPKDIIRWRNQKELDQQFIQRLTTLYEPRKYIASSKEASKYFASAALRNEAVFVSYSGKDRDLAAGLIQALRSKFQQVFDYRDQGESIMPGRRWIEEVFDKLSSSAIGIPLLSASYFTSGNCMHEAREMISLADLGKLQIIPLKLKQEVVELPSWLRDIQYLRAWEFLTQDEVVAGVTRAYDASRVQS